MIRSAKLADIAALNPKLSDRLSDDTLVSFLSMSAVTAETASTTPGKERQYLDVKKGYTPFLNGDILVAKITPCFENGKIAQASLSRSVGFGSTEFHVVRPHSGQADARYLLHFLRQGTVRLDGQRRMTGSGGQRRVPEQFLSDLLVPLPSLAEQRRIAAILDKAEELRAKRRAGIAQLDPLAQSIFLEMFGDPATNPKGWPIERLGSQIDSIRYGTGSPPPYVSVGVPFIRATNIKSGTVVANEMRFISDVDALRLSKCRVRSGDMILVRSGVNAGDSALVPHVYDRACAAFDLVVELSSERAVFYNFLINSAFGRVYLFPLTRRAAQPHLNADQVREMTFVAPPDVLKDAFRRRIVHLDGLRLTHECALRELDALFASLQYRAFRGEL